MINPNKVEATQHSGKSRVYTGMHLHAPGHQEPTHCFMPPKGVQEAWDMKPLVSSQPTGVSGEGQGATKVPHMIFYFWMGM